MKKTVKLLLYCTKAKPYLYYDNEAFLDYDKKQFEPFKGLELNGKIVAETECDLVEKEEYSYACDDYATFDDDRLETTCLSRNQINEYGKYRTLYLIHLKNAKSFEEARDLSEYYQHISIKDYEKMFNCEVDLKDEKLNKDKYNKDSYMRIPIKRASQNMMYAYDKDGNLYILISIQSPYMCDIMNDKKTIEIRTSILNLLKELMRND